ncbi:MAG: phosphate propanoyltransferase [Elusimicrobiaceae bacterium]|nr:phosphate propanoyltransferase [Elusimicrobiaceae bacterium]
MKRSEKPIPVGISNRHIHVTESDFKVLFGADSRLTVKKDLAQPGQYACEEVVTLEGDKGKIDRVRILGPYRAQTQVEVSVSDAIRLGVSPVVRDSGKLAGTPGLKVTGPKGSVTITSGVIVAKRHIHLSEADAAGFDVRDGELVRVRCGCGTERELVFEQVLCRVSGSFALEAHFDMEEANAAMLKNGDKIFIV